MTKNYLLLSLIILLLSGNTFASKNQFESIKSKIDFLENSVIADFRFNIPEDYKEKFESTLQISLSEKLENAFREQQLIFENAETKLFRIGKSLREKVENGSITPEESRRLMTNIEYARRIILKSRKSEVIEKYTEYKNQLRVKPTIAHLFRKITKVRLPGSCKVQDAHLEGNFLTFEVLGIDKDGSKITQKYTISKTDVELGSLTTRASSLPSNSGNHKSVLSFKSTQTDLSLKKFSLFENGEGEFYHAEFIHEDITEPLFSVWGMDLGEKKVSQKIYCNHRGIKPASIEDIQREEITNNFNTNQALLN